MSYRAPARTTTRRTPRTLVAALLVVSAAIIGALGYQSLAPSSSTATSPIAAEPPANRPHDGAPGEHRRALGEADGAVPHGTTVFDDEIPGVANVDQDLLGALRRAATDAADDGVEFLLESGWRSPEYQKQLLDDDDLEVRLSRGSCSMGGQPEDVSSRVGGRG